MKHIIVSSLAATSIFFTSCGDKDSENGDTGINKDNLKAAEAVENWRKDITEGRVASLWDSFPESYQGDINSLANKFGEKMDAEVYNEAMSTLGSASELLKNKKGMILEILKEKVPQEEAETFAKIEQNYDSIVGLVHTLANSDAKDIEGVKKLNVGKLLGELQVHTNELSKLASLAGEDFEQMKAAKITLLSESENSAEVNVEADGEGEDIKLVKKDDRWVPADMVTDWPEMIVEANKGIDEMGKMSPGDKQKAIMGLGMVKSSIKSLESVKSKEEMMSKIEGLMGMFGGM